VNHVISSAVILAVICTSGCSSQVVKPAVKGEMTTYRESASRHRILTVIWRVALIDAGMFSKDYHHFGTPAVADDGSRVFTGAVDGSVFCLRSTDGKVLWRKQTDGPVGGQPLVAEGVLYVGSIDGKLYAFRMSDGELLWNYRMPGAVVGQPVLTGDKILAMTDVNSLTCLEAQTGKWLWSYRRPVPAGRFQVRGVADPLVVGETVYAGFSDGFLVTLSLVDGSLINSLELSGDNDQFGDVDTTPIMEAGNLVTGSFGQGVVALDPQSMTERWKYKAEGPSALESADGMLYFSTADGKVAAVRATDGKLIWRFSSKKGQLSRPVVAGNWLLVSSEEYSLLALDRRSGKLVQIFNPGKGASAAPVVAGSRVYWTSNGETLYAMSLSR